MTMRLRTLLGAYPVTKALKDGSIKSDLVEFDFKEEYSPTHKGFRPMVREAAFDVSELAIVTYLMAKSFDKPMVLLPHVVTARSQHDYALYNAKRSALTPAELNGKRVGIRSFTTTTGAWLRGILANDYGVDLESIEWVTFEDAHVGEFVDTTKRAPAGKQIVQMLVDGELDAVLGEKVDRPDLKPLFTDADAKAWSAKHCISPINHMVVVSKSLSEKHPEVVHEVYRLMRESRAAAPSAPHFTADDMQRSLQMLIRYLAQQKLIPAEFSFGELFDDVTRALI
jgi:4,5-dihydroxyphthalate decarboxylase